MEDTTVKTTEKSEKSQEKAKAPKKNWFKGLKAEFSKIIWPDKNDLLKQSAAVLCISIVVGLIITFLDTLIQYGINFLTAI